MTANINLWVEYIGEQSVPFFRGTVETLLKAAHDDEATCKQLADSILRDPALTARVIKIANSTFYNRSKIHVHDVRRAVLLIGFNKIYEICLTTAIIETLLNKNTCKHVYDLLAVSLCAAVLATSFAKERDLTDTDELFISALLYNFGELAFWSLTGEAGEDISGKMKQYGDSDKAQRELLGITFRELTLGLSRHWNLGELLNMALSSKDQADERCLCLQLAHRVARDRIFYFDQDNDDELVLDVMRFIKKDHAKTEAYINRKLDEAMQVVYLNLSYNFDRRSHR